MVYKHLGSASPISLPYTQAVSANAGKNLEPSTNTRVIEKGIGVSARSCLFGKIR